MRSARLWTVRVVGPILLFLLALPQTSARAQLIPGWDVSVSGFVGAAFPVNADADVTNLPVTFVNSAGVATTGTMTGTVRDVNLKTSVAFGGKLGAWTTVFRNATGVDFGAELDVTHFTPDADGQSVSASGQITSGGVPVGNVISVAFPTVEISATVVGLNLLVRKPLYVTDSYPNGGLQLYFGGGVGAEMADLQISGAGSAGDTTFAYQALAGTKLFFTKNIAVFAEYKFTSASHSWDVGGTKVDADLRVNHVIGGLAFHF